MFNTSTLPNKSEMMSGEQCLNSHNSRNEPNHLTIYIKYFSHDTRIILTLMHAGGQYKVMKNSSK